MDEKLEFASDPWLAYAGTVLADVVREAGDTIRGQHLSVCERFADPPEHLRQEGINEVAWSFAIADGGTSIGKGVLKGADYTSYGDYKTVLPGVRTVFGSTVPEIEARLKARREAVAAGRARQDGTLEHIPLALRLVLIEFHNRLARRTA